MRENLESACWLVGIVAAVFGMFTFGVWVSGPSDVAMGAMDFVADGRSTADLWASGAVPEELAGCSDPRVTAAMTGRAVIIRCDDGARYRVEVVGVWTSRLGAVTRIVEGGL